MSGRARKVARGVAVALVVLGIVTVRVLWSARVEWQAAEGTSGEERLVHLGRAARLYAPGNPWSRRALDELAQLGREGGAAGGGGPESLARSLAAWQEVRSAILATRSFYTPHRELLDEANRAIAERMARAEDDARGPLEARRAWHAARLAQDSAPSVAWTLVALAGLASWLASAVGFFLRAVDERDRLRRGPALLFAGGVVIGLTLFFLGLARA